MTKPFATDRQGDASCRVQRIRTEGERVTIRPTLLNILRANDVHPRRSTYGAINPDVVADLLARDVQRGAKTIGLTLLCVDIPTREGLPSTTITDPDDASQVVAEQST